MLDLDYEPKRPGGSDPWHTTLRAIIFLLAVAYTITIAAQLSWTEQGGPALWETLPCLAWICAPMLLLAGFAMRRRASAGFLTVLLATTLVAAMGGWVLIWYARVVAPDPQNGLMFLWLTPAQVALAAAGIGIAYAAERRALR